MHLLSAVKKRGKIQTGLNCEYDGLSEVVLTLSHSSSYKAFLGNHILISKYIQLQCFQNMDHPKYAAVLMNGNKWCGSRAKQPLAIPSKVFEFSIG